jgi:hypothetical protein
MPTFAPPQPSARNDPIIPDNQSSLFPISATGADSAVDAPTDSPRLPSAARILHAFVLDSAPNDARSSRLELFASFAAGLRQHFNAVAEPLVLYTEEREDFRRLLAEAETSLADPPPITPPETRRGFLAFSGVEPLAICSGYHLLRFLVILPNILRRQYCDWPDDAVPEGTADIYCYEGPSFSRAAEAAPARRRVTRSRAKAEVSDRQGPATLGDAATALLTGKCLELLDFIRKREALVFPADAVSALVAARPS